MTTALGRRLRTLFKLDADLDADMVGLGLAGVALALGIGAWLGLGLSFRGSVLIAAASFAVLLLCLAHRWTAWLAAILGVLALSASPALVGAALGSLAHPEWGAWAGGVAGLMAGARVAAPSFWKVMHRRSSAQAASSSRSNGTGPAASSAPRATASPSPSTPRTGTLEDFLYVLSDELRPRPDFASSAGDWCLYSCLAEVGGEAEAHERFREFPKDEARLKRRRRMRPSLQAALVAGFYATFKLPEARRRDWRELFAVARKAAGRPELPAWAEWSASLSMREDDVEGARVALRAARRLGIDPRTLTADPEWAPFLERHRLRSNRRWAALLGVQG